MDRKVARNPLLHIASAVTCKAKKRETAEHKLKILKRELENVIRKLFDWKDFVFADPLLPFGTSREANAHCTHLQIAQANPPPKFAKECNLAPAILIIQNSGSWRKISYYSKKSVNTTIR